MPRILRNALAATLSVTLLAGVAVAQERYPSRPLLIVVPTAAAGGQDVITRIVQPHLREVLGQQVIVDNRPGAGGTIAAAAVARAKPDGHTLFAAGAANGVLTRYFFQGLSYDPEKDLIAVASMAGGPNVIVVSPALPVETIDTFVAYARKNKLTYASSGVGSVQHIAGELFNQLANTEILHVPFKGSGEYLSAVVGNSISLSFSSTLSTSPLVRSGKLKALAVTAATRNDALPQVPSVTEYKFLEDFIFVNWVGLFAPSQIPQPVLGVLNKAVNDALARPGVAQAMKERGNEPMPMSVVEVQDYVKKQGHRIVKVVNERKLATVK
jgi:tripartite-type tricarboxylate transporter receptor subunit TctC